MKADDILAGYNVYQDKKAAQVEAEQQALLLQQEIENNRRALHAAAQAKSSRSIFSDFLVGLGVMSIITFASVTRSIGNNIGR